MNQIDETTATAPTKPKVTIPVCGDPLAPLCVLDEPCSPQPELYPAYIDINTCAGEIEGGYNPESGVPEWVHRDIIIRIPVPPAVSGEALRQYLDSDDFLSLYRRIVAGHAIEYHDHLYLSRGWGRLVGVLDDDAREAVEEVEADIEHLDRMTVCDVYYGVLDDFKDEVTTDTTDEELQSMAADFSKRCSESGIAVIGEEPIDALRHLRDEAAG